MRWQQHDSTKMRENDVGRYASGTEVSEGRSKEELERTLMRFGAEEFIYGRNATGIMIGFRYEGRAYRISVPMPGRDDECITHTPTGYERAQGTAEKEWAKECRRRWRVLCAYIKALVVGVEEGVLTWEEALLPYALLETGQTVAEQILPQMEAALANGTMKVPALLPGLGETGGVIDVEAEVLRDE